jgi:hypothetical protein
MDILNEEKLKEFSRLVKDDNFRLFHSRLLLIYQKKINKIDIGDHMQKKISKLKKEIINFYISSNELITVCLFKFNKNLILKSNAKKFDYITNNGISYHPIIRTILANRNSYQDCLNYFVELLNDDDPFTNHDDLNKGKSLVERIFECKSAREVINLATKPSEVKSLLNVYSLKTDTNNNTNNDIVKLSKNDLYNYPWQLNCINMLFNKNFSNEDRRYIYWYYDEIGGTGKTQLATYLEDNYPDDVLVINEGASTYHLSTVINNERKKGWNGNICIFDLPRTVKDRVGVFNSLEAIRGGRMIVLKYNGEKIRFNSRYIVVFANFLPQISGMSVDRWIISEIDPSNGSDMIVYDGREKRKELIEEYKNRSRQGKADQNYFILRDAEGKEKLIKSNSIIIDNYIPTSKDKYEYDKFKDLKVGSSILNDETKTLEIIDKRSSFYEEDNKSFSLALNILCKSLKGLFCTKTNLPYDTINNNTNLPYDLPFDPNFSNLYKSLDNFKGDENSPINKLKDEDIKHIYYNNNEYYSDDYNSNEE